uniref:Reverse transcriptase domain-containing protein n=1 Tax=Ananas comosus var. bracteatus TaxID=296719 RepID=A0A6V7PE22_ANACO|nr:unnamed protein product [Ananas comosus var. bracteatus]
MLYIKGKASVEGKIKQDIASTKRALQLCIRCKAEITHRDWEVIIQERKLYREWKEFMTFPVLTRWLPKEKEVRPESDSLAEVARESEESKQKVQEISAEESSVDVSIVYAVPHSFRVESTEFKKQLHYGEESTVAQLQLKNTIAADAVIFEKPLALQTSHYNLLLKHDWIHAKECVPSTLHGKLFQWVGDCVEEIKADRRPQMVDVNMEDVGHINWVDTDLDQILFVRITEERVQLVLLKALVATEESPDWLKECQGLGAEVLDELRHNEPIEEVGYSIKSADLADEKSNFQMDSNAFRLENIGATYKRVMNFIFHNFIGKILEVYIEDIIVKSKSQTDHWVDLELAFERMRKYNLKINPLKCAFEISVENFLGFLVH